ncbi:hypothetical protein P5G51_012770 [Virgibacillus sp. 179-BFC.A HS]|uniref:DUF2564 family protein n=1 Tax=Tigheibacillus jepli TaxID=3035914 RepID=A0ABU5CIG8_9BACI|nr:hypothetical protein [Virgibacillus sp. 179-BFC.A HS]MDY0406147.1 hypothetical protein [Virgibacillus sp. 179-BFC.A HS]
MAEQNLQQQLDEASSKIKQAQEAILQAQGTDPELLQQAEANLLQAKQKLEIAQNESGTEATENAQFQQAYEQLHNTRQQVQEAQQNNNDVL